MFILLVGLFVLFSQGCKQVDVTNAFSEQINMVPTLSDSAGVEINSDFLLLSNTKIDCDAVKDNLSIKPNINFTVKEQSGNVLIMPEHSLKLNCVYRFVLNLNEGDPLKWAFQTKGDFKVDSTVPRDKSTGVPTNTGIEVTFSHSNFESPSSYIEISPKVKGRFEIRRNTLVFIPENLEPAQVYTVKIKKGLKLSGSNDRLDRDYVFQFETQDPAKHNKVDINWELFNDTMEFTTKSKPAVSIGIYGDMETAPEAAVDLYRYKDAREYIEKIRQREEIPYWAYYSRQQYLVDPSTLIKVANFKTKLKRFDSDAVIEFPRSLPAGYYLADISIKNIRHQLMFQVTDMGVYSALADNQAVVWVNDLAGGNPISNAKVTLWDSEKSVWTDAKGFARIDADDLKEGDKGIYLVVSDNKRETVAIVIPEYDRSEEEGLEKVDQNYWKYLYLERNLYQPDDTINFWGIIKPREKNNSVSGGISVSVTKWDKGEEKVSLTSRNVTLNGITFTGSTKLPHLVPGNYSLIVRLGEQEIIRQGFEVQQYKKSSIKLEAEPSKKAIFAGEEMNFSIKAACFEDTVVPNVTLNYCIDETGQITTDNTGKVVLSYCPQYQRDVNTPFSYKYLYLTAALPESGEVTGGAQVIVLNNDVDIEASGRVTGNKGQVDIELRKLTVDRVNKGQAEPWDEKAFEAGIVAYHPSTVEIYRQEWEKIPEGEYYNYIEKKVEKKFRYEEKRVFVSKKTIRTGSDGKAALIFNTEPHQSYWVKISTFDLRGNEASTEIFLSGSGNNKGDNNHWYHLTGQDEQGKYRTGDIVRLTFKDNETDVADRKNSFMFLVSGNGIISSDIQSNSIFSTEFKEADIPNYWVRGVYFDGKFYHETADYFVSFDEKEKVLDISIQTDKKSYKPQEMVNVTVNVKDKQGRPVVAVVNLNLVDEALYALEEQKVDFLADLYGDYLETGIMGTTLTHKEPNMRDGSAEKGGEDGSKQRDYKDAVFFHTLTTDESGKGQASFRIPDNLTSWRLICQAVTEKLEGASGTANIKVKAPFTVNAVLNQTYLTGDQPIVTLKSLGSGLNEEKKINYCVNLKGNSPFQTIMKGKAFEAVPVALPPLNKGSYELIVKAETEDGVSDILYRSFDVTDTMMSYEKNSFYLLDPKTKIKSWGEQPVKLIFSDYQRSQVYNLLRSLTTSEGLQRVDQKVASEMARRLINKYYPYESFQGALPEQDLGLYQTKNGGVALLPYKGADLEVTAKIAAVAKDEFDQAALKDYFYQIVKNSRESRERVIISLYGLAALEEPVWREVNLIKKEKELTLKEHLYLTLALAELGDNQQAKQLLKTLLKKYGEENGPYLQINALSKQDDMMEATALAALAAAKVNLDEQYQLQQYVMDNQEQGIVLCLEKLMFLQESLPKMPLGDTGFSYSLKGEEKKVNLKAGKDFTLLLTPEDLAQLKFAQIQGRVGVTVLYSEKLTASQISDSSGIPVTITRSYKSYGKNKEELKNGDLIVVYVSCSFKEKVTAGTYKITDYLPAGLKIVQRPYNKGLMDQDVGYPMEINGSRAVFLVPEKGSFYYYARVVNSGKFLAESAFVQNNKTDEIYGISNRKTVIIK
jgi:hypothetical protein